LLELSAPDIFFYLIIAPSSAQEQSAVNNTLDIKIQKLTESLTDGDFAIAVDVVLVLVALAVDVAVSLIPLHESSAF